MTPPFRDRTDAGEQLAAALRDRGIEADEVVYLELPRTFRGVGQFYGRFDQVQDAEAIAYLE